MSDDDFEEIYRRGAALSPCTVRCVRLGRFANKSKTVSMTFRTAQLPADVVEVLRSPRLSVAYSPSQRAVRVKADAAGVFNLTRAPRGRNADSTKDVEVWLLRFPWTEKMPWFEERTTVELDCNAEQKAVFVDIPTSSAEPPGQQLQLPAPRAQVPDPRLQVRTYDNPSQVLGQMPQGYVKLRDQHLKPEEAALMRVMADGVKRTKPELHSLLMDAGFDRSINAVLGHLKRKLAELNVEVTESTSGDSAWLSPVATAALARLVKEAL